MRETQGPPRAGFLLAGVDPERSARVRARTMPAKCFD